MAGIPRAAVDDVLLHGPATAAQLARTLGADVESVRDILDDMTECGDAERVWDGPDCVYRASSLPPSDPNPDFKPARIFDEPLDDLLGNWVLHRLNAE